MPAWLLTTIYAVGGATILLLGLRIWKRRQVEQVRAPRPVVSPPAPAPEAPVSAATKSVPADLNPATPPVKPAEPIELKKPAPVTPMPVASVPAATESVIDEPVLEPALAGAAVASTGVRSTTWNDRQLFAENSGILQTGRNRVASSLDPEELPYVDPKQYAFGPSTPGLAALLPETEARRERQQKELVAAGYNKPTAWTDFAATRYVLVMVSILFVGGLLLIAPQQLQVWLAAAFVGVPLLMWSLPALIVRSKSADRVSQIRHGMPDMLDMLNMCVSQGLPVPDSLKRVGTDLKTAYPALSEELAIVSEQAHVGSLDHALKNFNDRIDIPEVASFTSLMIQSDRMGTNVSDSLNEYSDTMRESMRQSADRSANLAAFKLLFPTVACLLAVFLFLMGPAVVEISNFLNSDEIDLLNTRDEAVQEVENARLQFSTLNPATRNANQ